MNSIVRSEYEMHHGYCDRKELAEYVPKLMAHLSEDDFHTVYALIFSEEYIVVYYDEDGALVDLCLGDFDSITGVLVNDTDRILLDVARVTPYTYLGAALMTELECVVYLPNPSLLGADT